MKLALLILAFVLFASAAMAQRTSPPSKAELAQDDIPEDTDVFHVLSRRPSVPQYVATKQYVFLIETDGTVNYLMTMEEFRKKK